MRNKVEELRGTPAAPDEAAAHWRVRHDQGDMSEREGAAFERWLDESPSHRAAWQSTNELWSLFDDVDDPHLEAMRAAARVAGREPRAWVRPAAAAIALVATSVGVIGVSRFGGLSDRKVEHPSLASRYETQRGERATATLADGTLVSLDSDTAIAVTFEQAGRHVQLSRGQALFEVAKDRSRPFVVRAGNSSVTALGTVFDVDIGARALRVVLVEGRVAVKAKSGSRSPNVILTPGQELIASRSGEVRVRMTDAEAALLWRRGLVEFNDATLAEAVEQLNRTSSRTLRLADPSVGSLRLSGIYRTGSPEGFVTSIAQVLPVTGRNVGDDFVIQRRK
jgi:transmembrane sensor